MTEPTTPRTLENNQHRESWQTRKIEAGRRTAGPYPRRRALRHQAAAAKTPVPAFSAGGHMVIVERGSRPKARNILIDNMVRTRGRGISATLSEKFAR